MHCQVQVSGQDSKGSRAQHAAFCSLRNGRTTLSCSGLLLFPQPSDTDARPPPAAPAASSTTAFVLAPVACLQPFIQAASRDRQPLVSTAADDLVPSVDISILINPLELTHQQQQYHSSSGSVQAPALAGLPARLSTVLQLPAVLAAAEELLLSVNAGAGSWKFGWCLADEQPQQSSTPAVLGHVAVLQVDLSSVLHASTEPPPPPPAAAAKKVAPSSSCHSSSSSRSSSRGISTDSNINCGSSSSRHAPLCAGVYPGQAVTVAGSPFGCLAEQQFFGAVVSGCVSLLLPPAAQYQSACSAQAAQYQSARSAQAAAGPALFLVDGRCMPGMEGGPIRCR